MLKVTINGEVFTYDEASHPLAEAIEIEEGLGMSFGRYLAAQQEGSAKATAGFVWSVLKRNGHDVPLADILSGTYPVNLDTVDIEDESAANPTAAAGPPSSPGTGGPGSASSPRPSAGPRSKSAGSPSTSSTT